MKYHAGQQVGSWKLLEPLGEGGNGEVWKASRPSGDIVALKILKTKKFDSEPYKRFRSEIEILQRIGTSQGVVQLKDFHLPQKTGETPPWLAMEIAMPIKKALGDGVPVEGVVRAIAEIASTLSLLDQEGIHHRDIKPDNLFSVGDRWVIGDFGLVSYPQKDALTEEGRKIGPLFYIAPEMLNNALTSAGGPADVYSLAKTFWVLATGQKYPLPGEQRIEIRALTLSAYSTHSRSYLLDKLIDKATRYNPNERPSMASFSAELHAWLASPQTAEPAKNLSRVSSQILVLMEPHKKYTEKYYEQAQQVKELLNRFSSELGPLVDMLRDAGLPVHGPSDNSTIVDVIHYNPSTSETKILTRSGISIVVATPGSDITLWSGIGIERLDNECVHIIAAHLLRSHKQEYTIAWSETRDSVLLGSAQQELAIIELVNNLQANVAEALEHYVSLLEEARDVR